MSNANIINGLVTGTGANIDITLGFIPSKVELLNLDGATFASIEWRAGMASASGIKRVTSTYSKITTLGVTPLGAGASDAVLGFRIGADTDVNVATNRIHWIAYRNGPGSGA